jgi:hypothetical protein
MGFLDFLGRLFGGDSGYWVYVRCNRCGEAIKTRINLASDLSGQDDGTYFVSKTLVGNQLCFERITVDLTFDPSRRRLIEQEINGGEFITPDEYQAAQGN